MTVGDKKVFGSGTRLYVTAPGNDRINPPTLTAYLPTKKQSGKQAMLCQATGMFPDLVKFNWKKKSNTEDWTDVPEENVVEQRNDNPVSVTSVLILNQKMPGDLYQCIVTHEGSKLPQNKILENDNGDTAKKSEGVVLDTCAPNNQTLEKKKSEQNTDKTADQIPSLYLFVYAYGVMLMKNGVYFCAVFIFLLKREVGKKEESSD